MSPREQLEALLSRAALVAFEALVAEKVDERLGEIGRRRIEARQRPELLTVAEAATLLRAKPQRVYDLLSSGRLTRLKDGSRVLIRRAEIEAWLERDGASARAEARGSARGARPGARA